jgi:hypothetical protein
MKSRWESYKGQKFFYADYSNFGRDSASLRVEVDAADAIIEKLPENSAIVLVDVRNTVTSTDVVAMMKDSAARTKGHVLRHAVVGVTGIQRVLASAVARFSGEPLHLFDSVDRAKEWLTGGDAAGGTAVRPD